MSRGIGDQFPFAEQRGHILRTNVPQAHRVVVLGCDLLSYFKDSRTKDECITS